MVHSFALRFGLFISLACAFWGANPAHAACELTQLYSQVAVIVNGFTERAKAGDSTAEAYLKLDDVKGSATHSTYRDQIPVFYVQNFVARLGGDAVDTAAAKASPSDYYLVIPADQSGPILEQAAASGKAFEKAIISTLRSIQGLPVLSRLDTLEDVRVTFYMKTTTASTPYPEIAIIGLQFAKATWGYGAVRACRDYVAHRNC